MKKILTIVLAVFSLVQFAGGQPPVQPASDQPTAVQPSAQQVSGQAKTSVPQPPVQPAGDSYLRQLQKRDSVLIGDQLLYGFELKGVAQGTDFLLPDFSKGFRDSVEVIGGWQLDTLSAKKIKGAESYTYDLSFNVKLTSFDEGSYELPILQILRKLTDGTVDTLSFNPQTLEVKNIQIDTASFEVNDIKGQVKYPLTFKEVAPYLAVMILLSGLIWLCIYLIKKYLKKKEIDALHRDPAHIVALRKLDKFRGSKYWSADKQKFFYSGVTDTLREYISSRYEVGAMEMTTAEIFAALKNKEIPQELRDRLKELFEQSDFVKFAKLTLPDEDNAKVVPFAVKFVSETYQEILEEEEKKDVL